MNTKEAPATTGAKGKTNDTDPQSIPLQGISCQTPRNTPLPGVLYSYADALRQTRRYADEMLIRLALAPTLADMHDDVFHAFVDIFVNTLTDPERDELCEYIKDRVGKLPADRRALADRVFFGKVIEL